MNHHSALRCWLFSLALLVLVSRACLANSLHFLSPDSTKEIEIRMLRHNVDVTEGDMEISCVAINQMRRPAGDPFVIGKVDSNGSQPDPYISWSPDSRYVVVNLSYNKHDLLRIFGFNRDKPFAVSISAIDQACPNLNKKLVATNKGINPGAGSIYLEMYQVAWTKDSRLAVHYGGTDMGDGYFSIDLLFDPETGEASKVNASVNDVEQKQPNPPAKASPAAPPARTGFWRIFKH